MSTSQHRWISGRIDSRGARGAQLRGCAPLPYPHFQIALHVRCAAACPMKKLLLHRDVYACRTDDGAVLLDLTTGKYFGLGLETTAAIAPRIQGWIDRKSDGADEDCQLDEIESAGILNSLMNDLGLLTDSLELGKPVIPPLLSPTESVPFRGNLLPWPRISGRHIMAFCCAYLQALFELRCVPIACTVRRVQARKSHCEGAAASMTGTLELVRIFRVLRPFLFTAKNHCLFDSLALIEFLARFGGFPTWVIGVRTRPFGAHSWVVHGNLILNELLEETEGFSPILAV